MSSEIRANTIKNRVGLGTVSFTNTGPVVSGIVTATTFSGSGASLTSIANANISASAAIAGSKITPNFGSQTLTAGLVYSTMLSSTGNLSLTGGSTEINLNRASHSPNYRIRLTGGSNPTMNFRIQDSTNSEDRFLIRHGGQIEIPGDVGIGHPVNYSNTNISKFGSYSTLHIKGPSNEGAAIRLQDNGDTADSDDFVIYKNNAGGYLRVNGTDPLIAHMNGAEKIRIKHNGYVGIGTDNPNYKLQVHDSAVPLRLLSGHEGNYDLRFVYQNSEVNIWSYASKDMTFGTRYAKKLHLVTNGPQKRLTIDDGGNVGIGSTIPNNPLTVHGSGNHIFLKDTATNNVFQIRQAAGVAEFNTYGTGGARRDFIFNQYATEVFRIDSSGRLLTGGATSSHGSLNADDLQIGANNQSNQTGITLGSASASSIRFADAADDTAGAIYYAHGDDSMRLTAGGTERLRITDSGTLNLTPEDTSSNYATTDGGIDNAIYIISNGTSSSQSTGISFNLTKSGETGAISEIGAIREGNGESGLVFRTRDNTTGRNERLRITSGGKVIVKNNHLTLENATSTNSRHFSITNAAGTTGWTFGNGVTASAHQFVIYDNTAGAARLMINSSGDVKVNSGNLEVQGGGLQFLTNSSTIQTGSSSYMLGIQGGATYMGGRIELRGGQHGSTGDIRFFAQGATATQVERLRISSAGDFSWGENSNSSLWLATDHNGAYYRRAQGSHQFANKSSNGYSVVYVNKNTGSGQSDTRYIAFYWNGTQIGYINYNSGVIQYYTGSDHRLKENITDITDGISTVKQLKPKNFNFINDENKTTHSGFLAHEVQEVLPSLVNGVKDEVVTQESVDAGTQPEDSKTGDPIYQGLDYGKVTPLLTAAIKELIAKVEALEADVAALKGS